MLALLAIETAPPELDRGKLVAFAVVHDLPEYHPNVGDTCTAWGLSSSERDAKSAREQWAVEQLRALGLHEIVALIESYERQDTPEAQWVRYVDKVCPKLTHILNDGRALLAIGMSHRDMLAKHAEQGQQLMQQYPQHARELFEAACWRCETALAEALSKEHDDDGTTCETTVP